MSVKELLRGFAASLVVGVLLLMFWVGMGMAMAREGFYWFLLCPLSAFLSIVLTPYFDWAFGVKRKGGKV